jgi:hypothetical protein
MTNLRLGWCSHEAAGFACRAWHYSRCLPAGKLVKIGAWENGRFVGVVIFGRGNTPNIGRAFGLRQADVCELTRVALGPHQTATSRVVAVALRLLRCQSPGLKLVVSYADPAHHHVGTIYQASGWLYLGPTGRECLVRVFGRVMHPRSVGARYGHRGVTWLRQHVDPDTERLVVPPKFKYVYPLDRALRTQLVSRVKPYPKASEAERTLRPVPPAEGGEIPTRSLHCGGSTCG